MPDGQGDNVVERPQHDSLHLLHVSCVLEQIHWETHSFSSFVVCKKKKNSNYFTDVLPTCLLPFILLHGILSIIPLALAYASEGNFYIILTGQVFGELE